MKTLKQKARTLRKNQTDVESRLWFHLRNRRLEGHKFYRQYPLRPCIVDFFCRDKGLIVELDGGQHTGDVETERDRRRTEYLERKGYEVVRFWNDDVLKNINGVLETISVKLATLTPTLFLKGEGESVLQ